MNHLRSLVPVVASLMLGTAGCGGSGYSPGSGNPEPPDPPDQPGLPPGNITVAITARDVFGAPVSGATIKLLHNNGTGLWELDLVTDAAGQAQITGGFDDVDGAIVSAEELYGIERSESAPVNDRLDFEVTLHPSSTLSSGVSRMSVTGVSADGRQLEFSARLYIVETAFPYWNFEGWNVGTIGVLSCVPDAGNDLPTFKADCTQDSADTDAPYEGSTVESSWVEPTPASGPLAVALLLDQGASVAVADTADRRLLAAKYFQTLLEQDDQVVLAAFASDDASTGQVALLPTQPVTIFPAANPAFTTDGLSYFPTIDALSALEGGASPLHAAIGEMIDFTANHAPAGSRRAVVALASGFSDCGSPANCQDVEEALRQQISTSGVAVIAVGISDASGQVDRKQLGVFGQADQGAVFWAQDATQVPTILGRLPEILDGRHGAIDVSIRLQSPAAGAFAPGKTVFGTLHVSICPWDCTESVVIPFALRVP